MSSRSTRNKLHKRTRVNNTSVQRQIPSTMNPIMKTASPLAAGWAPIECLPQGILERIAEFHGDIAIVSPDEQADKFTENIIDSAASNTWQPRYQDLRSLALTSTSLAYPAQRALFQVAVVKTTGGLMRFIRSLILYPKNRCYVRYLVARITDHIRPLPIRFIPPQPLVLSSFMRNIYPILSTPMAGTLPERSFLRQTLKSVIDTLIGSDPSVWGHLIIQIVGQSGANFHTIEDQVLTTAVQLCPRIAATRLCFGQPRRHIEGPEPADQTAPNTLMYSSLLNNYPSHLKALTLDFGALYSLTNLKRHVPGYPTGCPPSIERLTLVGNRIESDLPYDLFNIQIFAAWLSTNKKLRELRLVDDFEKMIRFTDIRESNHATGNSEQVRIPLNWNDIILEYKDTLEVLVMGWHRPIAMRLKPRFGASGMLNCLPEMRKLRYLKAPLVALGGGDFIVPLGNDGKLIESVRTRLPGSLRKLDLVVVNPPATRADRTNLKWRVIECRL